MFVYFIRTTAKPFRVKIGKSSDPIARMRTLQTGCPVRLKLLGTLKCESDSHAFEVEKAMHEVLAPFRLDGEWFKLTQVVRLAIHRVVYSSKEAVSGFFQCNKWKADVKQASDLLL